MTQLIDVILDFLMAGLRGDLVFLMRGQENDFLKLYSEVPYLPLDKIFYSLLFTVSQGH